MTKGVGVWSGDNEPTGAGLTTGQVWVDTSGNIPVIKTLVAVNPSVWRTVGTTYLGGWDPAVKYIPQDVVDYGNATYVCIDKNTNVIPTSDLTKWIIFAWKGPYASGTSSSTIDGVNVDGLFGMPDAGFVTTYGQFGFPNPAGWLWCDGTLYNNSQFPALAQKINRAFTKSADPPGTFRVPEIDPLKTKTGQLISYVIKT